MCSCHLQFLLTNHHLFYYRNWWRGGGCCEFGGYEVQCVYGVAGWKCGGCVDCGGLEVWCVGVVGCRCGLEGLWLYSVGDVMCRWVWWVVGMRCGEYEVWWVWGVVSGGYEVWWVWWMVGIWGVVGGGYEVWWVVGMRCGGYEVWVLSIWGVGGGYEVWWVWGVVSGRYEVWWVYGVGWVVGMRWGECGEWWVQDLVGVNGGYEVWWVVCMRCGEYEVWCVWGVVGMRCGKWWVWGVVGIWGVVGGGHEVRWVWWVQDLVGVNGGYEVWWVWGVVSGVYEVWWVRGVVGGGYEVWRVVGMRCGEWLGMRCGGWYEVWRMVGMRCVGYDEWWVWGGWWVWGVVGVVSGRYGQISAKERRYYKCNIFSSWLRPCSSIDRWMGFDCTYNDCMIMISHWWLQLLPTQHWLTHWDQNKMAGILQTMSSNAFSWMKIFWFKFNWNLLRVQIDNKSSLVQVMAWCHIDSNFNKPLPEPMMVLFIDASLVHNMLTHIPLNKMATILQTIFSDAVSWMKSFVFWLKFHWSLFLRM